MENGHVSELSHELDKQSVICLAWCCDAELNTWHGFANIGPNPGVTLFYPNIRNKQKMTPPASPVYWNMHETLQNITSVMENLQFYKNISE